MELRLPCSRLWFRCLRAAITLLWALVWRQQSGDGDAFQDCLRSSQPDGTRVLDFGSVMLRFPA